MTSLSIVTYITDCGQPAEVFCKVTYSSNFCFFLRRVSTLQSVPAICRRPRKEKNDKHYDSAEDHEMDA
jgi:hypothetical protein